MNTTFLVFHTLIYTRHKSTNLHFNMYENDLIVIIVTYISTTDSMD